MTSTPPLAGIVPYVPTPINASHVDAASVRRLVEHLLAEGVTGISPLGSTGEVMYLTPEQRLEMVQAVVAAVAGRVPVVVGVAAFSSEDVTAQIRRYEDAGADAFVVILQRYFPLTADEQYAFFASAAQATDAPIVVYSNPLLGADITADLAVRLSGIDNIRYLKDASGNTGRLYSVIGRVGSAMSVFAASAHVPALVFQIGGVGWMSGPACVAPRASVALYDSWKAGDLDRMWRIQRALWPLNELFGRYSAAAFIKFALNAQGFDVGEPCPPKGPLPPSVGERFSEVMRGIDEALAS
ncbi:dihydrodipicolinate synthase family protein [Brooklawnia cerclae]|uniref:4-hydroxy-tetrahydrodipicolinate synthase n=1 Tax=Brooklawnia cerclae TaxID=349934 RepID=A0ABX0SEA0_9ACTN|nr:dihydrodipicolinate synthase family protein [Brooklawnia cerclae]NIH56712.1 4-hydroxy-tetrahydrodipicolinate synthase [Brooklawnia cerclae]